MIDGRVLYVDKAEVWLARGRKLLTSEDAGQTWHKRSLLPVSGVKHMLSVHRLGRRVGRVGFHHFGLTDKDSGIVMAHGHIFYLIPGQRKLAGGEPVVGSRPLALCIGNDLACYGEYRGNAERAPVHIWATEAENKMWRPAWRFDGIRHVHGVFFDPYTRVFWVTTGDKDDESAIWNSSDRFKTLEKVAGGSQRFRAVHLLFTADHVYFGSDAPDEQNSIYRMDREGNHVEQLTAVGSSVFHGCKVGNHLFFSTAVEPSTVNRSRYAEIWGSANGQNWQVVSRFEKDIWPIKYFQYGQVLFPAGRGDGKNLWFTPMATNYDQKTFQIPLDTICE